MTYFIIIIFLLGISIGSFLNVIVLRLAKEESFTKGRSYCPDCNTTLGVLDLIPVLSFVFLGAKCRYCSAPLAWQYPAVELLTGAMFVLTGIAVFTFFEQAPLVYQISYLLIFLIWISNLIVLLIYDLKYKLVPEQLVWINIALGLIFLLSEYMRVGISLNAYLGSAVLAALAIWSLYFVTKKQGMGFGDVELMFMLGLILPLGSTWFVFFLAFVLGSIYGMLVLLIERKRSLKVAVPFGPALITSFCIVWYAHLMGVTSYDLLMWTQYPFELLLNFVISS
ncbi:MAG: A24 family peptidase [Candidatus Paceibacteria bacterium]